MPTFNPFDPRHPGEKIYEGLPRIDDRYTASAEKAYTHHLEQISADPSGSDPNAYLSPKDAETMQRFIEYADALAWRGADEMSMMRVKGSVETIAKIGRLGLGRNKKLAVWGEPKVLTRPHIVSEHGLSRTGKSGLTKTLLLDKTNESVKGIVFGRLNTAGKPQLVAICSDGLFRSLRGAELLRSEATGWGRLPDPDLLNDATRKGQPYGVDYRNFKSRSLNDALIMRLSLDARDRAAFNAEDFGLKTPPRR